MLDDDEHGVCHQPVTASAGKPAQFLIPRVGASHEFCAVQEQLFGVALRWTLSECYVSRACLEASFLYLIAVDALHSSKQTARCWM